MPRIETWSHLPSAVRDHLVERMQDRNISLNDLNALRLWVETEPEVPEGRWFRDFGSFKICGEGKYPKAFLRAGRSAAGTKLQWLSGLNSPTIHSLPVTYVLAIHNKKVGSSKRP